MSRYSTTRVAPTAATPATINCMEADSALVQIIDLSGGDSITVQASLDGTNFADWYLENSSYAAVESFTADGMYSTVAGCHLRFTKSGSASSPSIIVRASSS
jgi:hypothetical protein